jgi:GxxExxY protein
MHENEISGMIIGAAIEVHRYYGPGLVEKVYEEALCHEFSLRNHPRPAPFEFDVRCVIKKNS